MLPYPEDVDIDPWDRQLELIKVLIDKGADPHVRNIDGETLLQVVVRDHDDGLIRLIEDSIA